MVCVYSAIMYITLPHRQQLRDELSAIREAIQEESDCHPHHPHRPGSGDQTQHYPVAVGGAATAGAPQARVSSLASSMKTKPSPPGEVSAISAGPANLHMWLDEIVPQAVIHTITPYSPGKPGIAGIPPRSRPMSFPPLEAGGSAEGNDPAIPPTVASDGIVGSPMKRPHSPGPPRRSGSPATGSTRPISPGQESR